MNEKSILEQALLQVQTLEEAVKANAKGILASTMKQELNDLLKESMEEEEEETPTDDKTAVDEQPKPDEEEDDMSDPDADAEGDENDDETSITDEPSAEDDDTEIPATDDDADMDADDLPSMDDSSIDGSDDMLDMTSASDEEVLKVFKAMSDEDGIVVKKDGNMIDFKDGEDEYIIKLDQEADQDETQGPDGEMFENWDEAGVKPEEEVAEEDQTVYEIELDGDDEEDEAPAKEVEATESARTIAHGYHSGLKSKTVYKAGNKREEMNEEVSNLKKQNAEYKKALILFKDKLNEVAVFNANLAYATRLFTEHSTTKNEKLNILKRFDTISKITESKNLYNSIKAELETKKPVTESVSDKITSTPSSSSSDVLSESKVYEAPQFTRMRDLMKKIK